MITLARSAEGPIATIDGHRYALYSHSWDALINLPSLPAAIRSLCAGLQPSTTVPEALLAPIGTQEVWAAGVTYYRSRDARMEESKDSGGQDFYAKVYTAARPELFMKASAHRVVGPNGAVRIRKDSHWNVPEPEFTLVINARGEIVGYTIGNDMSSRDIEGENPLYLPQAKVYDQSCAVGPVILVKEGDLNRNIGIALAIERGGETVFSGTTDLTQLKRSPEELVSYLYLETTFPTGAYLLTGTGIVPGNDFTLQTGDVIKITIDTIGTLTNTVG